MTLKAHDILLKARELIASEEHWCKLAAARGQSGESVNPRSSGAVSFCIEGALARASYLLGEPVVCNAVVRAREILISRINIMTHKQFSRIYYWNDSPSTKHKHVLRIFDEAIEVSKGD